MLQHTTLSSSQKLNAERERQKQSGAAQPSTTDNDSQSRGKRTTGSSSLQTLRIRYGTRVGCGGTRAAYQSLQLHGTVERGPLCRVVGPSSTRFPHDEKPQSEGSLPALPSTAMSPSTPRECPREQRGECVWKWGAEWDTARGVARRAVDGLRW